MRAHRSLGWFTRRWPLAVLSILVALGVSGTVAHAYWDADGQTRGPGAAGAATVGAGAIPTVAVAGAAGATVTWAASELSTGQAVDGYVVRRYAADTGVEAVVGAACSGTVTARTCTEDGLPPGEWTYTVTPVFAVHWRGVESEQSAPVTIEAQRRALAAPKSGSGGAVVPSEAVAGRPVDPPGSPATTTTPTTTTTTPGTTTPTTTTTTTTSTTPTPAMTTTTTTPTSPATTPTSPVIPSPEQAGSG